MTTEKGGSFLHMKGKPDYLKYFKSTTDNGVVTQHLDLPKFRSRKLKRSVHL